MIAVTNSAGRTFNVRVVHEGDEYGLNDCLVHDGEPMVEFYDATYEGDKFGPRGQFVSRYYLSTLTSVMGAEPGRGLNLDGGVPVWQITAENVAEAIAYALEEVEAQ